MSTEEYGKWLTSEIPSETEMLGMRYQQESFHYRPLISVCFIVSDADEIWVKSSLDSLLSQIYTEVEVIALDNACKRPHMPEVLREYSTYDERIKYVRSDAPLSNSQVLETAANQASGDYITFLAVGDTLSPAYAFRFVEFMQHTPSEIVYCDEDRIDIVDIRSEPKFKPYWSPDLLLEEPYIGRSFAISSRLVENVKGFSDEHDMLIRASRLTVSAHHVPGVLYSRRTFPFGEAEISKARGADLLSASKDVADNDDESRYLATSVSIILVPDLSSELKDPQAFLNIAVNAEIEAEVLSGKGSDDLDNNGFQNIARNLNLAARTASGDVLIFVNESVRSQDAEQCVEALLQAIEKDFVGSVSCKVVNSTGQLRYGGTLHGVSNLAGIEDIRLQQTEHLLVSADLSFNPLTLSQCCFAIRKDVYEQLGGLDEENCPNAFYALDLSARLRRMGLLNAYVPDTVVTFDGYDPVPSEAEVSYVWETAWQDLVDVEYYSGLPQFQK